MSDLYFPGSNWFGKLLRFFNLLEPDNMVLSISKIVMWVMAATTIFVLVTRPEDLAAVMGSLSGSGLSFGNYMYRRREQRMGVPAQDMTDEDAP